MPSSAKFAACSNEPIDALEAEAFNQSFNLFGFFAFPYVILIYLIRILHFFWIDILYGIVMIFVLKDLFFDK